MSERGYEGIKTVWTLCLLLTGIVPFGMQN